MTGDAFDGFKYTRFWIRKLFIISALKLGVVADDKSVIISDFNLLNSFHGMVLFKQ